MAVGGEMSEIPFLCMLLTAIFLIFSGFVMLIMQWTIKKIHKSPLDQKIFEILRKIKKQSMCSLIFGLVIGIIMIGLVAIAKLYFPPFYDILVYLLFPTGALILLLISGYYSSVKILQYESKKLER